MKKMSKKNIALIGLSVLFIIWTILVMYDYTLSFDKMVYEFLILFKSEGLTTFMRFISDTSRAFSIVCFILVILILHNKIGLLVLFNALFNSLSNQLLKQIIQRQRPLFPHLQHAKGYSFPSGHTMIALSFYGYLLYLTYHLVKRKWLRNTLYILFGSLILLVGLSRIYLGVHFASDVIGGYIASSIYLIVYISVTKKWMVYSDSKL